MKDAIIAAVLVIASMISEAAVGYALRDHLPSDRRCTPFLTVSFGKGDRISPIQAERPSRIVPRPVRSAGEADSLRT